MLFVILRELTVIQVTRAQIVHLVVDHLEVHVEDHAEQPVAPEHVSEQLGVARGGRGLHLSVAQHDAQRFDGRRDGTGPVRDAVRIHAQGAADGEDVDRLHRLDRQPLPIEQLLHVRPHRAALYVHDLPGLVERDPVQPPHVEHQTVLDERLPTHAVPLPGGGHLEAVVPGKPQGVRDVPFAGDLDDAVHVVIEDDFHQALAGGLLMGASSVQARLLGSRIHVWLSTFPSDPPKRTKTPLAES